MEREDFEKKFGFIQSNINGLVHVCGEGFIIYTDNYQAVEFKHSVLLSFNNVIVSEVELSVITEVF